MTDNNKLRKLTAEMFEILSISGSSMRLEERNLLWTLFVEAAKCCRSALEAWVRKKIFLGQSVPMMDTEVEDLCDRIEEIALKHLLNQLQGEEQNPSYFLGPSDK